ncbi:hypothetical protein [Variovorax sp. 770b2]|uniref:hypothetical protein n=1 Tax=Variovorax sp. 770b2 TaxID=1566271 RepID=UPI00116031CA|nr:hypothetical protein [Variovorax sp. 770b2]
MAVASVVVAKNVAFCTGVASTTFERSARRLGDGRPFDALEEAHQPCLAGRIELADPRDMAEQVAADA